MEVTTILGKRPVRTLIFDETLKVIERARGVLGASGAELTFAGSLPELELAVQTFGPHELLIIDMSGDLSGWAMAEQIRRMPVQGRVVALMDQPGDPRSLYLSDLARVECVVRPEPGPQLDQLLKRLVAETPATPPRRAVAAVSAGVPAFHGIVGQSRQMLKIFSLIEKVAPGDANVCVYGESGTGKELIARAVHRASPRTQRPLITLDCTAIPEGLMESQLFGHVRGAFTGAIDHRDGVFALAHTGSLFMDELCELSLPLQAKLLRVIQTREFCKVGSSKPITTNIRLITATNRDLKQAVDRGEFREDLYYRVAVIMIKVLPLRERREDIPLLVEYFLQKFSESYRKRLRGIAPQAMDRIVSSPWPGNVRQLQNFLEQAVVLADGEVLRERDLFVSDQPAPQGSGVSLEIESGLPLKEVERRYILRTLTRVQGSRTQAAKVLGISLRALQYKLKAYSESNGEGNGQPNGRAGARQPAARLSWMDQT